MIGFQNFIRRLLNARGRTILREMIVTMCAGDPEVLTRVRMQRVILRTEKYVSELPFIYFVLFKVCLYMIQFAVPPLSWKLRPFTWLSLDDRLAMLVRWQASNFYFKRMSFKMIQAVCVSHLYSERRLLESLGFGEGIKHREERTCLT